MVQCWRDVTGDGVLSSTPIVNQITHVCMSSVSIYHTYMMV